MFKDYYKASGVHSIEGLASEANLPRKNMFLQLRKDELKVPREFCRIYNAEMNTNKDNFKQLQLHEQSVTLQNESGESFESNQESQDDEKPIEKQSPRQEPENLAEEEESKQIPYESES